MIKTTLKTITIAGVGAVFFMSSNLTWAKVAHEKGAHDCVAGHPESCHTQKYKRDEENIELEKDIIELGPQPEEIYEQQYPDYLPGESEVLRVEPGPDLSRTEPFVNNPYK